MKFWFFLSLFLVASTVHQTTAVSCRFYVDQFFGYTCELNDASVTTRDQVLTIDTSNHLAGRNDSQVTAFEVGNTTTLNFFPSSILTQFSRIRYLLLDHSGLTELTPFVGCQSVVVMFIRYSAIRNVPSGIFDTCENLQVLDLSDNEIETIDDDAFENLGQLLELDINHNRLTRIQSGLLRNQVILEELNFRYNEISEIEDGAFSTLSTLITFYLRNNRLTEIRPEMFGDDISLVFFNLNENLLTSVPRLPSRAPRIKYIYLAKNLIAEINEGDFTFAYSNITNIDLSENLLTTLPAAPFEVLSSLDILLVNDNAIEAVDYELFDRIPSLYTFYFLQNKCANIRFDNIRSIDQDEIIQAEFDRCFYAFFEPLTNVTCNFAQSESSYACSLSGITFQNFRDKFTISGEHDRELTNYDVTQLWIENSNISRVPPTLFRTFPNLQRVTIVNSELSVIDANTFELCGEINFLDLSRNRIRRLSSHSFNNCYYVEELILDNNQISEIAPCNTFLANIYQTTKLSMRNNICVNQYFDSTPEWLTFRAEETVYPYLNRCFSLWYLFLDSLNQN
jgi:Leucine-rich repeat (LRR) protein